MMWFLRAKGMLLETRLLLAVCSMARLNVRCPCFALNWLASDGVMLCVVCCRESGIIVGDDVIHRSIVDVTVTL